MKRDPVKKDRNTLIHNMRKQGNTFERIKSVINSVYPTDAISIPRIKQISDRAIQRELLNQGGIPEIGDDLEHGEI